MQNELDWRDMFVSYQHDMDEFYDSFAEASDEEYERKRHMLELSEQQVNILSKALEEAVQSGKVSEKALGVSRAALVVAIISLIVMLLSLSIQLVQLL